MDNENYSHQPDLSTENYTYPTNTSPHSEGRRLLPWIVAVVLGLVLVGGASVFIMLTTPGQKILNTFSPTVERTLAIAAREFSVPQSYEVEVNEGTYITQA